MTDKAHQTTTMKFYDIKAVCFGCNKVRLRTRALRCGGPCREVLFQRSRRIQGHEMEWQTGYVVQTQMKSKPQRGPQILFLLIGLICSLHVLEEPGIQYWSCAVYGLCIAGFQSVSGDRR